MLDFNAHGFLIPDQPILTTQNEFNKTFVQDYSSAERLNLYKSYCDYSDDLKSVCGGATLRQWINGSFVTKSNLRPSDIDMITFIDAELILTLGDVLNPFKYPNSKINYPGIDSYLVSVYDEGSQHRQLYLSDELHWRSVFDTARRNRAGVKHRKGFLEIMH